MKSVLKSHWLLKGVSFIWPAWWKLCLGLWVLSMVPTPLFPDHFLFFSYLSTLLLSLGVLGYALERYGQRAYVMFATAFGFGVLVEWLGEITGFPFGSYVYTAPGPHLLGVPLMVPLGWWAFSMIALAIPSRHKAWLSPLALVTWDLGLDPLMVQQGFWEFVPPGIYFGIPLSNFLGWYGAGWLLMYLLLRLEPALRRDTSLMLRSVFAIQAFFIGIGLGVFYQLFVAGLIASTLMLLCLLIGSQLRAKS